MARPDSAVVQTRDFAALDAFRVLYPPKGTAIRPLVARLLIAHGVPLFRNRIETASPAFGRALTLAGPDTVWIISKGVVAGDIAAGLLVPLSLDMAPTLGAMGIMSRAGEVPSVPTRAICTLLNQACQKGM